MARKKKPKVGGAREGAGRPPVLKDPIRRNIIFEPKHLKRLTRYAKRHGLRGYSQAVRHLIENEGNPPA